MAQRRGPVCLLLLLLVLPSCLLGVVQAQGAPKAAGPKAAAPVAKPARPGTAPVRSPAKAPAPKPTAAFPPLAGPPPAPAPAPYVHPTKSLCPIDITDSQFAIGNISLACRVIRINGNNEECCKALAPLTNFELQASFISNEPGSFEERLACYRDLFDQFDEIASVVNKGKDVPGNNANIVGLDIFRACQFSWGTVLSLDGVVPEPCPRNGLDVVAGDVQMANPGLISQCIIAAADLAAGGDFCQGTCMTGVRTVIDALASKGGSIAYFNPGTRLGCFNQILTFLGRNYVSINVLIQAQTCDISRVEPGPPPPGTPLGGTGAYGPECPISSGLQVQQTADTSTLLQKCNDFTTTGDVCRGCLSAIYRGASQLLQNNPRQQLQMAGSCFVVVLNWLALQGASQELIKQVSKCVENPTPLGISFDCPLNFRQFAAAQGSMLNTIYPVQTACNKAALQLGFCDACRGSILPAALSVPNLVPTSSKQVDACVRMVRSGLIQSIGDLAQKTLLNKCFANDTAAPVDLAPYDPKALAPLPSFPLAPPSNETAPGPAPGALLAIPPPPAPPKGRFSNESVVDPNQFNSNHGSRKVGEVATLPLVAVGLCSLAFLWS